MLSWAGSRVWRCELGFCVVDSVCDVDVADAGSAQLAVQSRDLVAQLAFSVSSSRMRWWARVSRCRSEASVPRSIRSAAGAGGVAAVVSRRMSRVARPGCRASRGRPWRGRRSR
jgi:hypothetical protein